MKERNRAGNNQYTLFQLNQSFHIPVALQDLRDLKNQIPQLNNRKAFRLFNELIQVLIDADDFVYATKLDVLHMVETLLCRLADKLEVNHLNYIFTYLKYQYDTNDNKKIKGAMALGILAIVHKLSDKEFKHAGDILVDATKKVGNFYYGRIADAFYPLACAKLSLEKYKYLVSQLHAPKLEVMIEMVLTNLSLPNQKYNKRLELHEYLFLKADDKKTLATLYGLVFDLTCRYGFPTLSYLLVDQGLLEPNVDQLQSAILNNHLDLVRLLLERGEDPTAKYNKAIAIAAIFGRLEIFKLLLENENPALDVNKALHRAATVGHVDIVQLCLKDKRLVLSGEDNHDYGALLVAADRGHEPVVKLLLEDGRIPPLKRDTQLGEESALSAAAESNHLANLKLLVTDERIKNGSLSPSNLRHIALVLYHAVKSNNPGAVKILLDECGEIFNTDDLMACFDKASTSQTEIQALLSDKIQQRTEVATRCRM